MRSSLAVGLLVMLAAGALPVAAHPGHTHVQDGSLVVGFDPEDDVHPLVADEEVGPTYRPRGADLRLLDLATAEGDLTLRLHVDRLPDVHADVVYVVAFAIDDRPTYTCWDAREVATPSGPFALDGSKDICARLAAGRRVGPTTTTAAAAAWPGARPGIVVNSTADGADARSTIAWTLTAVDLPDGVPRFLTDVRVQAWTIGEPAGLDWSGLQRAPFAMVDRAPDSGTWSADLAILDRPRPIPGLPRLVLTPQGTPGDRAVADRGDNVTYRFHLKTHDLAPWMPEHTYRVSLLLPPDGVTAFHDPASFNLSHERPERTLRTSISIGPEVAYATYGHQFHLMVCHASVEPPTGEDDDRPPNACVSWPLHLLVTPRADPAPPRFEAPAAPVAPPREAALPGPGAALSVAGLVAVAVVLRRSPRRAATAKTASAAGTDASSDAVR